MSSLIHVLLCFFRGWSSVESLQEVIFYYIYNKNSRSPGFLFFVLFSSLLWYIFNVLYYIFICLYFLCRFSPLQLLWKLLYCIINCQNKWWTSCQGTSSVLGDSMYIPNQINQVNGRLWTYAIICLSKVSLYVAIV